MAVESLNRHEGRQKMKAMERLVSHINNRLSDLSKARGDGCKVVGYTPGGYLPEELVLACGAIPIGLIQGGDYSAVEAAGAYICRWIDPFCRAQIGYGTSGDDPYYSVIDLLTIPITDNHIRAISDTLAFNTDIDIFPFGVPHKKDEPSLNYYASNIMRLIKRLEALTGVEITDSRLKEAIHLCNRERQLLRGISMMRRFEPVCISSQDFVFLNHASMLADKMIMVEVLETLIKEISDHPASSAGGPRILLTGSTLALGDSKVLDIIDEAGGVVVIEEFAEGIRPYWRDVGYEGYPVEAIVDSYFMQRIPPAWFRPGKERLAFLMDLAKDFGVSGVIWYQLLYRESYKIESYFFPDMLKREAGLDMLTIESEYDATETEPLKTRIETFIETLRR